MFKQLLMANKDLKSKLGAINKIKEQTKASPKPVIQEAKAKRKVGRPTWRVEGVDYAKVYTHIPEDYKDKIKIALVTTFKGRFSTQDEVINQALTEFLQKHQLID